MEKLFKVYPLASMSVFPRPHFGSLFGQRASGYSPKKWLRWAVKYISCQTQKQNLNNFGGMEV